MLSRSSEAASGGGCHRPLCGADDVAVGQPLAELHVVVSSAFLRCSEAAVSGGGGLLPVHDTIAVATRMVGSLLRFGVRFGHSTM